MIIYVSIFVLGVVGFFIHLFFSSKRRNSFKILELFLLYQLVFSVGLSSFLAAYGFFFMTQFVADYTHWPSCPFEIQMGNVNLGYGVLGILCIWFRNDFWTATIIGQSIWLIGDGIAHLYDMAANQNYSPGNIGVPLYTDLIVPIILLILLAVYKFLQRKQAA